jgi:ABC-type bacteriocin/lantibiotic exporter with double-glycine peptidase domain
MDPQYTSLLNTCRRVGRFVVFVATNFASFYCILALTLLVLFLEYAATSLMIPLSSSAGANSGIARFWIGVLGWAGMKPVARSWLWLFFLVMTARLVFGYVQTISTTLLGKKVHRVLSGRIFGHVVSEEPLTSVYLRKVGHYITLAGDDTSRCGTIIASLIQCTVALCTALVAIVILHQFSPLLFIWVTIFMALCGVGIAILFRYILKVNAQSNLLSRELNTAFVEALNNLRSIRALHAESFVSASYAQQIAAYVKMLFKIEAVKSGIKSFPAILLLVSAAILVRTSTLSGSDAMLLAATIIVIRMFAAMGQFISSGTMLLTDIRAVHDIESLTRLSPRASEANHRPMNQRVESILLRGVDFGYGERVRILKDFSFRFEMGKIYAIVGPSGSGKSTLADIMLGLVSPDKGTVTVNRSNLPLSVVRGKMMLVEQQPRIFSNTLRENLLFGFQAPDERLWEALRLVDLEQTVTSMRNGLDTVLSYQGENFSGGQRQRIGIARGLVRNPDVLILDEATSALDAPTRKIVLTNVRRHMSSGVLVLITHDRYLAEMADIVLDLHVMQENSPLATVQ